MQLQTFGRLGWVTVGLMASAIPLHAGSINLRWDAVPGAAGYRIYYGDSSRQYRQVVDVGGAIQGEVKGLPDCQGHFLAVKAYNAGGESVDFSNEIEGWPRPEVASSGQTALVQGAQMLLTIPGRNFQSGAQMVLSDQGLPTDETGNPLVRVDSLSVVSCDEIQALVTVEPTARGFRAMEVGVFAVNFEIYNPDSVYGSGPVALDVQFNQERLDINRSDSHTQDRVDGKDLAWLAFAHAAQQGDLRYNPDADLNGDGRVDGEDLAYLASGFGACWTGTAWSKEACH
jgi:hypothetical protein